MSADFLCYNQRKFFKGGFFMVEIILKIICAVAFSFVGSLWINFLYSKSTELTFPKEISSRSKFRKPILFFSLAILFNITDNLFLMTAAFLLVLMTITDFEQYMLFDALTFPLIIIGAVFAWQNSTLQENFLAALIGGGIFLLLAIISKGSLGGGDVKLIFALGMLFGSEKLLNVVLTGTIAGGVAAVLMILAKKKDRKSYFAYGPYFTLSAIYFLLKSS